MSDAAANPPEDVKPDPAAADTKEGIKSDENFINLRVCAQDHQELHFRIKRTTKMQKLMTTYCGKQGLEQKNVRFLFDGEAIKPEDTPESLDMEDKDAIDVMQQQTGGGH
eukprot:m.139567 g.139567  ORF g.139567 m.139567 type:complete len:110 (-) comp17632_c0_seq1:2159-2488(-)